MFNALEKCPSVVLKKHNHFRRMIEKLSANRSWEANWQDESCLGMDCKSIWSAETMKSYTFNRWAAYREVKSPPCLGGVKTICGSPILISINGMETLRSMKRIYRWVTRSDVWGGIPPVFAHYKQKTAAKLNVQQKAVGPWWSFGAPRSCPIKIRLDFAWNRCRKTERKQK